MSSFRWFFDCLTEWSISCFVWVIFFIWVLIIFWHLRSKIDERQISYFRKMSSVIIWKKKVNLSWDLYNGNIGIKTHERCMKSVCIWSYSGRYFPAFGLNTEKYLQWRWRSYEIPSPVYPFSEFFFPKPFMEVFWFFA